MVSMMSGRLSILQSCAIDDVKMTPAALRVLVTLGTYSDPEGWCWPSQSTLGERLGVTSQAVGHQIRVLRELGYVEVRERRRKDGGKSSNLYRLLLDFMLPSDRRRTPVPDLPEDEDDELASHPTPPFTPPNLQRFDGTQTPEIGTITTQSNDPLKTPSVVAPNGRSDSRDAPVSVVKAPTPKKPRAPRPPTPMETAVYAAWGVDPTGGGVTKAFAIEVSSVAGELTSAGADPAQVTGKKAAYERDHPRWDCTPRAVAKHWPLLRTETTSVYDSTAYVPVTTYRNPYVNMIRREDYIWDTDEDAVRLPGS